MNQHMGRKKRSKRLAMLGQSIIEVVVGVLVLIPVVALAVDANALLGMNRANQELAHNVARAAANKTTADKAEESAKLYVQDFEKSKLVQSVKLTEFDFDIPAKLVTVTTTMEVGMPVPLPWTSTVRFSAHWAEPIVSFPAAR
jgi:hypothetical protein